ncbi:MAG: microcystin-dependent protein [Polyangiales bacterium]|jgi:microcystin-dependent protein
MSDPYIGQVTLFAGNFAPRGWAFCDGQLLAISSNTALFSIIGTIYGGDGRTTFALPDLRGRVPVGPRTGAGLNTIREGQRFGQETHTLTPNQMPAHSHALQASTEYPSTDSPTGAALATQEFRGYDDTAAPSTSLRAESIASAGGSQSFPIAQPSLGLNYIIAVFGVFPSRS